MTKSDQIGTPVAHRLPSLKHSPLALILLLAVLLIGLSSIAALAYLMLKYGVGLPNLLVGVLWTAALATILLADDRRLKWAGALAIAASLGLRAWAGWLVSGRTLLYDPKTYSEIADHLLAGQGIWVQERFGVVVGAYPPLYPILLAAVRAIAGPGIATTVVLNTAIDIGAAFIIWMLARRLGADRGAMIVALFYLLLPTTVLSAPLPQKEGLTVLLVAALLLSLLDLLRSERLLGPTLTAGAMTALIALTQPGFVTLSVLLYVVFFLFEPRRRRRLATSALGAFGVTCLVMLPWWIRNYNVFGTFVPLTTVSGVQIWVGATRQLTSAMPLELLTLPEPRNFNAIGDLGLRTIAEHPVKFVLGSLIELGRGLSFQDFSVHRLLGVRPMLGQGYIRTFVVANQLSYMLLLGTVAWAIWSSGAKPAARFARLALGTSLANMLLFQMWFEFVERHRLHMTPALLLIVAMALSSRRLDAASENAGPQPTGT